MNSPDSRNLNCSGRMWWFGRGGSGWASPQAQPLDETNPRSDRGAHSLPSRPNSNQPLHPGAHVFMLRTRMLSSFLAATAVLQSVESPYSAPPTRPRRAIYHDGGGAQNAIARVDSDTGPQVRTPRRLLPLDSGRVQCAYRVPGEIYLIRAAPHARYGSLQARLHELCEDRSLSATLHACGALAVVCNACDRSRARNFSPKQV